MCKWYVWTGTSSFHILMSCYCWSLPLFPVPLVSRICPSDTYRVWKSGQCLRVDTTLMGFEQMTWQRGNRSFIFRGQGVCHGLFPALILLPNCLYFSLPVTFKSDLGLICAFVLDATSRSAFFQTSHHWHGNNLSLTSPQSLIGFLPFALSLHLSFRLQRHGNGSGSWQTAGVLRDAAMPLFLSRLTLSRNRFQPSGGAAAQRRTGGGPSICSCGGHTAWHQEHLLWEVST